MLVKLGEHDGVEETLAAGDKGNDGGNDSWLGNKCGPTRAFGVIGVIGCVGGVDGGSDWSSSESTRPTNTSSSTNEYSS